MLFRSRRALTETTDAESSPHFTEDEQRVTFVRNNNLFAISLRDRKAVVGGIVGEVWSGVLFIQFFWIEERFRGKGHGTALIEKIEEDARRFGAVRSYLDTMSFQAPAFYRSCGYEAFGAIDGYPGGVTRHWFTKAL